jgi:transcriptional regulator with XRE-family HTH domain
MATTQASTPWRSWRETLSLSLREVSRRTGINPGRLSIIERGVPPTEAEANKLRAVLIGATPSPEATA